VPRYHIIPQASQVWIEARSVLHPINTCTDGIEGHLDVVVADGRLDLDTAPSGSLSFDVERLSSGNRFEDREMHRRIDARRYPTIDGVLAGMEQLGTDGTYQVSGTITFHGVTRAYKDEMHVQVVDDHTIRLDGRSSFDIRDFGMDPPRILFVRVEPQVEVRVEIVAQLPEQERQGGRRDA
jgi:polyisoprenoid-binding protein YceI